jgi:OOP family OmpA-OmpF porin
MDGQSTKTLVDSPINTLMNTMKTIALPALALVALLSGPTASAQNLQMSTYLGASAGVAHWNANCSGTTSCKTTPATLRVYGGYNFTPNVGIELTYASLGTVKAAASGAQVDIKGTSMDVSGVYKLGSPSSAWGGFVKGGLAYTQAKVNASSGTVVGADTKNAWGLIVGIGATYALTDHFALRAELDTQTVKVPGSSGNVTSFTVGAQGAF